MVAIQYWNLKNKTLKNQGRFWIIMEGEENTNTSIISSVQFVNIKNFCMRTPKVLNNVRGEHEGI